MCVGMEKKCVCGSETVSMHNGAGLPYDVVVRVWCPACSESQEFIPETMIKDRGWMIEYDMELAVVHHERFKFDAGELTSDALFDKGFSCWTGHTPTDVHDKVLESLEITKLAKSEPKKYFTEIKRWNKERVERFKKEGWRKLRVV